MQLKMVVLPAPLGPMSPTISNSSTRRVTSLSACNPPKRMDTSVACSTGAPTAGRSPSPFLAGAADRRETRSRTGIAPPSPPQRPPPLGQLEALPPQPPAHGRGDRAQAGGVEEEGEAGPHRAEGA